MLVVRVAGWSLAAALGCIALDLRRRLELVARAEHELRGPLAAIGLAVERLRRGHGGAELAEALDAQLDRGRAGLADLHAARTGSRRPSRRDAIPLERHVCATAAGWEPLAGRRGRPLRLDWRAGAVKVAADRGHLAQALGNLISNAVEHGGGPVEVRGRRDNGTVRVEVRDAGPGFSNRRVRTRRSGRIEGRGRGLAIAAEAVEEAGGALEVAKRQSGATVAVELPVAEP